MSDNNTPPAAPKLLDRVRNTIRLKHYSLRAEQTYVHWIKRFIYFHGKRHPRELGEAEVTAFLNDLARVRNVASATQNQALSAVLRTPLAWHRAAPGASCAREGVARVGPCQRSW